MTVHPKFEAAVHGLASQSASAPTIQNLLDEQDLLPRYGIDTPLKIAHFLSQTAHESGGFKIAVENLRYTSAERLCQVWPSRFPSAAAAAPYVNQPEKLANNVYANRIGNGPPESGDGFRFRGRGLIQITGRANYEAVGAIAVLSLVDQPELAELPEHSLLIACATWKHIGAAALPETASVEQYTRKVNGGVNGLDDRTRLFAKAKALLGLP